jgi:hypothetical protein
LSALMEPRPMAKAKGRPKVSDRDDGTVRLDRTLIGRAKMVANYRGVPVAQVLSEIVKGPLDKAYAQMLREMEGGAK